MTLLARHVSGVFSALLMLLTGCTVIRHTDTSSSGSNRPQKVRDAVDKPSVHSNGDLPNIPESGRVTVVVFLSLYCVPCKRVASHLDRLHRREQDRNLQVIGILENTPVDATRVLWGDMHLAFPVWVDEGPLWTGLPGIQGLPAMLLYDAQGVLRHRWDPVPEKWETVHRAVLRWLERSLNDAGDNS